MKKESRNQAQLKENEAIAMRVSARSMALNIVLTAFKLVAGIVAHSGAMISDAIHSASDVISTIIVMIGVKMAGKAPDRNHPYGHDRFECVASIVLSVMLGLTGAAIGIEGLRNIVGSSYLHLTVPGKLALAAAVISIVTKEGMFWYTRINAKKIRSSALMADAWHHRSDALSSVGSFVGILGARLGFPIMDPLASVIISFRYLSGRNIQNDRSCLQRSGGQRPPENHPRRSRCGRHRRSSDTGFRFHDLRGCGNPGGRFPDPV